MDMGAGIYGEWLGYSLAWICQHGPLYNSNLLYGHNGHADWMKMIGRCELQAESLAGFTKVYTGNYEKEDFVLG
eukprot:7924982-Ditylum_brightwellii.AAC.1